jgi:hypothetical protein
MPTRHRQIAAYGAARQRPYGIATGIALSLAFHAMLLFAYRYSTLAARPADSTPAVRSIAVWLRPPVPLIPPEVEAAPEPARRERPARPRRRAPAPTEVIAMPETARATPPRPDTFSVEPVPAPDAAPRFDPEAARATARQIASEPDPARAGTAVAQLEPKPYATETKAARAIARAKRRDCKDGLPGGLLGPLLLLMDKKDSGCKW